MDSDPDNPDRPSRHERPIPSAATASQSAETAARALGDAVHQIADRVAAELIVRAKATSALSADDT